MKVTNVARRVWTTVLVKVVLRCKIVIVDILARVSTARRQFRGLSDWLGAAISANFVVPPVPNTEICKPRI